RLPAVCPYAGYRFTYVSLPDPLDSASLGQLDVPYSPCSCETRNQSPPVQSIIGFVSSDVSILPLSRSTSIQSPPPSEAVSSSAATSPPLASYSVILGFVAGPSICTIPPLGSGPTGMSAGVPDRLITLDEMSSKC